MKFSKIVLRDIRFCRLSQFRKLTGTIKHYTSITFYDTILWYSRVDAHQMRQHGSITQSRQDVQWQTESDWIRLCEHHRFSYTPKPFQEVSAEGDRAPPRATESHQAGCRSAGTRCTKSSVMRLSILALVVVLVVLSVHDMCHSLIVGGKIRGDCRKFPCSK